MKKTMIALMILTLSTTVFLNEGLIDRASADSDEDETFYGEIVEINNERRRLVVVDERTFEEHEFRVFRGTLSKINLRDRLRIDYSPNNGLFDMFKIAKEGNRTKIVKIE